MFATYSGSSVHLHIAGSTADDDVAAGAVVLDDLASRTSYCHHYFGYCSGCCCFDVCCLGRNLHHLDYCCTSRADAGCYGDSCCCHTVTADDRASDGFAVDVIGKACCCLG